VESFEQPLDVAAMRQQLGDDEELFADLIELFLADYPGRLQALETALAASDFAGVRSVAHTIKGGASNLCASRVVQAARTLEAVSELGPAFCEVARLLRPGGRFVFTSFNAHRLRPFGSYRLSPDTREHTLAALVSALDLAGLRLVGYRGTFFISPGFVWRYHGALRWPALRRPYVRGVVAVNRLLDVVPRGRRRCGQFVVLAEKPRMASP